MSLSPELIGRIRELRGEARIAVRRRANALCVDSERIFATPRIVYSIRDDELTDSLEVWLWATETLLRHAA